MARSPRRFWLKSHFRAKTASCPSRAPHVSTGRPGCPPAHLGHPREVWVLQALLNTAWAESLADARCQKSQDRPEARDSLHAETMRVSWVEPGHPDSSVCWEASCLCSTQLCNRPAFQLAARRAFGRIPTPAGITWPPPRTAASPLLRGGDSWRGHRWRRDSQCSWRGRGRQR